MLLFKPMPVDNLFNVCKIGHFSGLLFHATGVILAIIVPIIFSILRLLFTSHAMNWYVIYFFYVLCTSNVLALCLSPHAAVVCMVLLLFFNVRDFMFRFSHPYLAFMMFIPCALMGLSIPRIVSSSFTLTQDVPVQASKEVVVRFEILKCSRARSS